MATVTALRDYREKKQARTPLARQEAQPPQICDSDIWSRDYSQLENIVFGVLKVVEVLEYYLWEDEVWPRLVLKLLDRSYQVRRDGFAGLVAAAREIKGYVAEQTDYRDNKLILSSILILDFIEKWPAHKLARDGAEAAAEPELARTGG